MLFTKRSSKSKRAFTKGPLARGSLARGSLAMKALRASAPYRNQFD